MIFLESVWIRRGREGFALGLTVDRLRQGGVRQAVLDYGGNLFVIGAHQDAQGGTRPWKVAIRDPDNTGSVFGTVQLQDAASPHPPGMSTASRRMGPCTTICWTRGPDTPCR